MISKVHNFAQPPLKERVNAEECEVRVHLAACYRLAARFRMTDLMYYLERACQAQVAALAGGANLIMQPPEIAANVAQQFSRPGYQENKGEWRALLRMLDKSDPSYHD